ncbi:MAG: diacylglycerol kinase family lipid kinase [Balneolaceae bacterium]
MLKELSYCLIVNKFSNSGKSIDVITKHINEIDKILKNVEIYELGENESISEITSQKAILFDVIVACGGDGTARKVAIGLKNQNTVFGVLPLGSGNDFAKMLNLSTSFEENLAILKSAKTCSLDLGIVNKIFFINTLGIGFDGFTNYLASKSKISGSFKYVFAGFQALVKAKPFNATITTDKKVEFFRTLMIIVANGKWEGGNYFVSPSSVNNDGLLELIVLKDINRLRLAIEFIKLSFGYQLSSKLVTSLNTKEAKISTSSSVFVHADGEVEKCETSFSVGISPQSLNVIVGTL